MISNEVKPMIGPRRLVVIVWSTFAALSFSMCRQPEEHPRQYFRTPPAQQEESEQQDRRQCDNCHPGFKQDTDAITGDVQRLNQGVKHRWRCHPFLRWSPRREGERHQAPQRICTVILQAFAMRRRPAGRRHELMNTWQITPAAECRQDRVNRRSGDWRSGTAVISHWSFVIRHANDE